MNKHLKTLPRYQILLNFNKIVNDPIPLLQENIEKHGKTYISYLGGVAKSFVTVDPELIQHVLQKNHKNYHKPKLQTNGLSKFVGHGLLTTNGSYWLRQRRLIQPGFHREKIKALMLIMNDVAKEYVSELKSKIATSQKTFDMHQEMSILTLKMVSRSLFSESIQEEELQSLNVIITNIQITIAKEIRQAPLRWWRKLTGEEAKMLKLRKDAYQLIYKIIHSRKSSGKRFDDLLDMLIHARYEDTGETMNETQIADEVMIMFAAGYETTANALSWSFYTISQNPDCKQEMLDLISSVETETVDFDAVKQLGYLQRIMAETMRQYPPAWITGRVALEDDQCGDIQIEKGDLVTIFIYGCHQNIDEWDEPEKFNPNRFTPKNKKLQTPYSYLPFSGGPRLCIGVQFAEVEMQIVLYHLYKHFKFDLLANQDIAKQAQVTLRPKNGVLMDIELRN